MTEAISNLPNWARPVQNTARPEEEEETSSGLPSWARPVQNSEGATQERPQLQEGPSDVPEQTYELPSWANQVDSVPSRTPQESAATTPSDLLKPENLSRVDKFLNSFYGTSKMDSYTPEERVDQFLNTWRYLEAGNTVKTLGFVDHTLSTDDFGRAAIADGYDLFKGLAGPSEYSFRENLEMIKDYAVGAIVDPVNIVAPLVGKFAGQVGSTATNRFALEMARKAAENLAKKGASEAVQIAAANRVKGEALRRATTKVGKAQAYREVMGATAFDMAVAAGTDLVYQHGLIQAGAEEEQDRIQTGLAALGGLVGGGIAAATVGLRGVSSLPMANLDIKNVDVRNSKDLVGTLGDLADSLEALPDNQFREIFKDKVARGQELEALDSEFWGKLLVGDDVVGFKGLGQIMYDKGFRYLGPRETGDNFTNWLADAFKNSPSEEALRFVKVFQDKTGVVLKGMEEPSINQLADNMAKKMSDSGYALGRMGQVAKMLRFKDVKDVTVEDYYGYLFGNVLGKTLDPKVPGKMEQVAGSVGEGVDWLQNSYIRMLVTHPGTSALNIIGWSAKSAGQSASDLLRATVLYGGTSTLRTLKGDLSGAKVSWGQMTGIYKANAQKVKNLLDPYTTAEAFTSLMDRNPDAYKELVGVLPGGVVRPVNDILGIANKDLPLYQQKGEKVINSLQTLAFVKAQDIFTKSQEMMYNLDIAVREVFPGESYASLIRRPDASTLMSSKEWRAAELKAMNNTLENILSKSYARHDNQAIRRVAGFIEDFRSIPVVGATIPFGRFFNNVVATMSEYSGANIPLKALGTKVAKDRDWFEVVAKPTVAWTTAVMLMEKEADLLDRGIAWDEEIDERTGQKFSERYNAPFIGVKALSRWLVYKERGEEVPKEFIEDASQAIFGQLTRQLSESGDVFLEGVYAVLTGDGEAAAVSLMESIQGLTGTIGSGATRFMDPVNSMIALGATPQEYMSVDVKTGNPGFAKAFRYLDQLIPSEVMGDVMPAQSPTSEYVGRQPSRIAGVRPTGPTTDIGRVFALVGRPQWDAGLFASDKVAQNIVVEEFFPFANEFAKRLLDNPVFIKGDLKLRQDMVSELLKEARDMTHQSLISSVNPDNPRMSLLFKLTQNNSVPDLEKYIKELGLGVESIHELTNEQLKTLKFFVDNDSKFRREDAYRRLGQ
jgi:hypothetical protein